MLVYALKYAGERLPDGGYSGDDLLTVTDVANLLAPAFVRSILGFRRSPWLL